jgi:hypothetical protein
VQPTAPFVWLALIAAPWVQSGLAQASNQVVFEKVATVGMEVPDTQVTLDVVQSAPISPDYFLEGGTVVFWGITKRPYHSGLFSAKDGQIKTVALMGRKDSQPNAEGIPEPFEFIPGVLGNTDIKAGGALLYVTLSFGKYHKKTRSVCVWDGEKLRPLLWHGESPAWLGAGEKIQSAGVAGINPDGSAVIIYLTESGQYGIASYSKAAGMHPLISTASGLPGMPGVTILKETFEPLFDDPYEKGETKDWVLRGRLAPPALLGDWLFLVVEPSTGHPFLARIGGGKTERIVEAQAADPTDPGFMVEEIRSFKALTPDVVVVEIDGGKGDRRLLVADKGKLSRIYQSAGAYQEVAARLGFKEADGIEEMGDLQVVSPATKSFCALFDERSRFTFYVTQVRCFDGTKMSNVTGQARIGRNVNNVLRPIPGLPGVLVIDADFTAAVRHADRQISHWIVNGNAVGQDLQPAADIYSSGSAKYTVGEVVGVDAARQIAWLRLSDGYYKVHGAGN